MEVLGLCWVGTRTDQFDRTVAFFEEVLELRRSIEQTDFVAFSLPNGDVVELFGPRAPDHDHFNTGPVVGFLVENVGDAMAEMKSQGVEFLGRPVVDPDTGEGWAHFRGPDGYVYEITANRSHPSAIGTSTT